jgi:hypothetical protein
MMDESPFRQILADQIRRYPRLQRQDVYKLIHQAALGSEHAVSSVDAARRWLETELHGLAGGPEEPVVDPISADGRIARIHLRPYLAEKGDLTALVGAFVRTASEYRGATEQIARYWTLAERMAEVGELPFTPSGLRDLFVEMKGQEFPAAHHSPEYKAAYRPAYRVIAREFLAWR